MKERDVKNFKRQKRPGRREVSEIKGEMEWCEIRAIKCYFFQM